MFYNQKRYFALSSTLVLNMKNIFFLAFLISPTFLFGQTAEKFTINGNIGKLSKLSKAYLVYQPGANRMIDSAEITDGKFKFTGEIIYPVGAFLIIDHIGVGFDHLDNSADVLNFYLEKGEMTVTSADSASKSIIGGSKINDDNNKLIAKLKPIFEDAQKIKEQEKSLSEAQKNSAEYQSKTAEKLKQIQVAEKATLKMFILANPDSYLSLLALRSVGGPSPDPTELGELFNTLSQNLKDTETGKMLKQSIDELTTTAIGVTAPDFTEPDVNGQPVKLSSFKGKYVLIDFWASWCGPCRQENPHVVKAFNKFKDKNFTVLGVSLDKESGKEDWLSAIKNDGLTWTQVSDLKFWQNEVALLYKITSIPSNVLIDPNGKIIAKNLRGADLENKLKELLEK